MNRTTALKALFDKWKASPGHEDSFVGDGIINEEKFHARRVLFLCKEPNQSLSRAEQERHGISDFQTFWKERLWYSFSINLATWAHGVLHNFVPYDDIPDNPIQALHSIAFMNLKKSGGIGEADMKKLREYAAKHQDFIKKEVEIIDPTLIIASIDCSKFKGILFNDPPKPSGHGIDIYNWGKIPVIDFYHPTVRAGVCMSYALLKLVVESEEVKTRLPKPQW